MRLLTAVAILLGLLLARGNTSAKGNPEADALAQRFLEHMAANRPIVGEFEVRTLFDPDAYAKQRAELEKRKITMEKQDQLIVCRWASDQNREVLVPLPGTRDAFAAIYSNPEALLVASVPDHYSLTKPGHVSAYRPASFYTLCGIEPWPGWLDGCEFGLRPAPEGSPAESVVLAARKPGSKRETRLLLDRRKGTLYGAEVDFDSKPSMRLRIDSFARSPDQRLFPSAARLEIYGGPSFNRPFRTQTLTARQVVFPATPEESEKWFLFDLPAGAQVADRLLNRSISIEKPTPAASILRGEVPSLPFDAGGQEHPEMTKLRQGSRSGWLYLAAGIGAAIILLGLLIYRSRGSIGRAKSSA